MPQRLTNGWVLNVRVLICCTHIAKRFLPTVSWCTGHVSFRYEPITAASSPNPWTSAGSVNIFATERIHNKLHSRVPHSLYLRFVVRPHAKRAPCARNLAYCTLRHNVYVLVRGANRFVSSSHVKGLSLALSLRHFQILGLCASNILRSSSIL